MSIQTTTLSAEDDIAVQVLSNAGAQCGDCGDQPGERICPNCESCRSQYVADLRAAGWAPTGEALRELADRADPQRPEISWFGEWGHQVGEWIRKQAEYADRRVADGRPALGSKVDQVGMARAAMYREAADECDKAGAVYAGRALNDHAAGAFALMETFLRKASEAEYVATPCDFVACEPGGEPCSTHERLMAHADGEHELCGPDCKTP